MAALARINVVCVCLNNFVYGLHLVDSAKNEERGENDREIDYQNCDGYFLCVFTKGGGCDLHRASEVKQVVSSLNKEYINVIKTDGDVTHYEDAVSYEFKHVMDLSNYNLKTVKRVTE